MPTRPGSSPGRGGAAVIAVLALACTAALLYAGVRYAAIYRTNVARAGWEASLGDVDDLLKRFPTRQANASAIELERLAAPLGIDIVPRAGEVERPRPAPERKAALRDVKPSFRSYVKSQIVSPTRGAIAAPPEELRRYAEAHERELASLRSFLTEGDVPRWESDLSRLLAAPIPNLLGQVDTHNLLTALALARIHAGDEAGALDYVEASWKLGRSLEDSPMLISQLVRLVALRTQVGLLRHLSDVPPVWLDRLRDLDPRSGFLTALRYEGWAWLHTDDITTWDPDPALWKQATRRLIRPYTQLCLADVSNQWRVRVDNLERVKAVCDHDLAPLDADLDVSIPRWNLLGDMFVPNLSNAIYRVSRFELDLELTRIVLENDAARRANGGRWRIDSLRSRESSACPGDRWSVSLSDGNLEIALSRDIEWEDQYGAILPTRITLR